MDKIMEKLNKLSLPVTILIASVILGGTFYAIQVNKQKSIDKHQMIEYTANRKKYCYEIYEKERKQYNNVVGYKYEEPNDSCWIGYEDNKTGEYFFKYF